MNNFYRFSLVGIITLFLVGCASNKDLKLGTVVAQQKVSDPNYKPKKGTVAGASVGAAAGAGAGTAVGAVAGGFVGVVATLATFGAAAPLLPGFVAAGATTGAAAGGVAGGVTGGAVGYAHDVNKQGPGLYRYTIKPDDQKENISITQYAPIPFAVNSRVRILVKDQQTYLESVEQCRNGLDDWISLTYVLKKNICQNSAMTIENYFVQLYQMSGRSKRPDVFIFRIKPKLFLKNNVSK
jgi:outer membrane lipoprotein SlyB